MTSDKKLHIETLIKTFLDSTGPHSWKEVYIFPREPIRRLTICLNTNKALLDNNRQNQFQFENATLSRFMYIKTVYL